MYDPKESGIFFALWPRRTPDGLAVGWLHYEWVDSWGWGSEGYWRYTRWVPEAKYNAGARAETWIEEQARLHAGPPPTFYTTPPDTSKCRNIRDDGATPCWHPHCSCMEVGVKIVDGKPFKYGPDGNLYRCDK